MKMYVDGGCRGNGYSGAIGAAACVVHMRAGRKKTWTRVMLSDENPTNQRAEITAIMLALEQALARYDRLHSAPVLDLTIYTDSKYAQGCMSTWIHQWSENGWLNSRGSPVANRDLIQEASDLDDAVRVLGKVEYVWIPRSQNSEADEAANLAMDQMEEPSEYGLIKNMIEMVCFKCAVNLSCCLLTTACEVVVPDISSV